MPEHGDHFSLLETLPGLKPHHLKFAAAGQVNFPPGIFPVQSRSYGKTHAAWTATNTEVPRLGGASSRLEAVASRFFD